MRGYSVAVYDCAGQFCQTEVPTFSEALEIANQSRLRYPDKVTQVFNLDRVDLDYDGLTDEEREQVESMEPILGVAIEHARSEKARRTA